MVPEHILTAAITTTPIALSRSLNRFWPLLLQLLLLLYHGPWTHSDRCYYNYSYCSITVPEHILTAAITITPIALSRSLNTFWPLLLQLLLLLYHGPWTHSDCCYYNYSYCSIMVPEHILTAAITTTPIALSRSLNTFWPLLLQLLLLLYQGPWTHSDRCYYNYSYCSITVPEHILTAAITTNPIALSWSLNTFWLLLLQLLLLLYHGPWTHSDRCYYNYSYCSITVPEHILTAAITTTPIALSRSLNTFWPLLLQTLTLAMVHSWVYLALIWPMDEAMAGSVLARGWALSSTPSITLWYDRMSWHRLCQRQQTSI